MQYSFILATVFGAGPALFSLYYVLRQYQGAWDDRKLFICLAVGMILGVVGFFFHAMLDAVIYGDLLTAFTVYVVGFAVLENLMLFAVLNFKWLRGKTDATFCGVSLGAGFGASGSMAFVYRASSLGVSNLDAFILISMVGISFATIFLRIANGAMVGTGSSLGKPWTWYGKAIIAQVPYGTLFMSLLYFTGEYTPVYIWAPATVAMVVYTYFVLMYVRKTVLPQNIPPAIRKKLRRERRKAQKNQ
jgi:hypothetical protein